MKTGVFGLLWVLLPSSLDFSFCLCCNVNCFNHVNNRTKCLIYAIGLGIICLINKSGFFALENRHIKWFFSGYLNDILGSVIFLLYLCLVQSFLKRKYIFRFVHIVIITFFCGILWEYLTPVYRPDTVSDPWDILAYMFGGVLFWYVFNGKSLMNEQMKSNTNDNS